MHERLKVVGLVGVAVLGGVLGAASWLWADRSLPADGARAVGEREFFVTVPVQAAEPSSPPLQRELPAKVFYPAVGAMGEVVASGLVEGPLASLVVWTHDSMGSGEDYESLARGLASRGHAVVLATHPGLAREVQQSDGSTILPSDAFAELALRTTDVLVLAGSEEFRSLMPLLKADQGALVEAAAAEVPGLTTERIVYGGHGVGGAVALHSCQGDERCAAVVDFGGPPLLEQLPGGLQGRAVLMPPTLEVPLLSVVAENVLQHPSSLPAMMALQATVERSTGESAEVVLTKAGALELSDRALRVRPSWLRRQYEGDYWLGEEDVALGMTALRDLTAVFLERHVQRNGSVDVNDAIERHERLRAR